MARYLLRLDHISKTFNKEDNAKIITVLDDIDFTVRQGEFVSILGPSGCGKSTLLKIIAGLILPTRGKCLYRGKPIAGPGLERGYVFQDPRLFPWLTVLENINLAGKDGHKLVKKMKLQDFSHALPHELSGGMARRAALARALAPKPDLLLLDEPFTNLDMPLRKELYNELRQIWLEGVTCILVTHDIDEALELGTRLVLLKERPAVIREDREINSDKSNLKKEFLAWMEVGG